MNHNDEMQTMFELVNLYADALRTDNPGWSDKQVCQQAEKHARHSIWRTINDAIDPDTGEHIPLLPSDGDPLRRVPSDGPGETEPPTLTREQWRIVESCGVEPEAFGRAQRGNHVAPTAPQRAAPNPAPATPRAELTADQQRILAQCGVSVEDFVAAGRE